MRPSHAFVALLFAASARAAIYENEIDADDEEDLLNLEQRGDISSDTAETLLELLREGVELNSAPRDQLYDLPSLTYHDVDAIIAYRTAKGRIDAAEELVAAGAITGEQFVKIAPFIRIDAARPMLPVSGRLRLQSQVTSADNVPPPALLQARLKGPLDLSGGFMLATTRRWMASPGYDAFTDTLVTKGFSYQPQLPRIFLQWHHGKSTVILGTFTVGFGERLTLDNTRRHTPHGLYLSDDFRRQGDLVRTCKLSGAPGAVEDLECASGEKNVYITPDFTWRDSFRGVAASIEDAELPNGMFLSAYGFASFQRRSLYQYELYDKRFCADPRDPSPDCKAPPVYLDQGAATGDTKLIYSTLPYLFDELLGGAHVDFKPDYRMRLGVTGYGAVPFFHAAPMQLDFQEWSKWPAGGPYGAVGLDGQLDVGDFDFHFEASRSFDRELGGGGGWGVVERNTWSPKNHELTLSFRFFDDKYANPYARPVSAPDMYEGQRARNELGARLTYLGTPNKDWELRGRADFWVAPFSQPGGPPAGTANLYGLARVDFTGFPAVVPAIWVDVRNRNLASSQHGGCSSDTTVYVEGDSTYLCSGDLYRIAARLELHPLKRLLSGTLQAAFTWKDDFRYQDRFRNDVLVWAEVRSQPVEWLQVRLKSRYLYQDLSDNTYLEQSWWTYLEAAWLPSRGLRFALRYDLKVWLDQRASTLLRVPSPEHRFLVDVRVQF